MLGGSITFDVMNLYNYVIRYVITLPDGSVIDKNDLGQVIVYENELDKVTISVTIPLKKDVDLMKVKVKKLWKYKTPIKP